MSTDGTQPPSFSPRTPVADRSGVRAPERPTAEAAPGPTTATPTGPATGPVRTGGAPRPAGQPRPGGAVPRPAADAGPATDRPGPSVTDRLKKAAQDVIGTTGARDDVDADRGPQGPAARTASERGATTAASSGPRRVRLAVARVDPWSVMKLSFLLSFAIGIMIVVAAAVVWMTLDGLGVFASLNATIAEIAGSETFFDLEDYLAFDRAMALATLVAVVDVILLTALSTIGAFLYNIVAALVGGINLTLTDD